MVPGLFGWLAFRRRATGVYLSIPTRAMTLALTFCCSRTIQARAARARAALWRGDRRFVRVAAVVVVHRGPRAINNLWIYTVNRVDWCLVLLGVAFSDGTLFAPKGIGGPFDRFQGLPDRLGAHLGTGAGSLQEKEALDWTRPLKGPACPSHV